MTVINHKSISGITSITAPAGSDDLLTVHTNDTSERFRILKSGAIVTGVATASNFKTGTTNVHNVGVEVAGINVLGADTPIGTGATIYNSGAAVFTGIVTATGIDVNGTGRFTENLTINTTKKILTNSSTGQLTIQAGPSYPGGSIKFAGGQSGATDRGTLLFYAGETTSLQERLRITSAGKVGINSTSPTYALEVDGGTQNTVIAVRSSDAKASISFLDNTSGGYGRATIGGEGDQVYITSGNGAEKIRFGTGGAGNTIGISTTLNMVTNSEVLAVRGYSTFKSTSQAYAALYVGNEGSTNDTANALILFNDGAANRGGIGYVPNTGELRFNNQYFMTFTTGASTLGGTERLRIDANGFIKHTFASNNSTVAEGLFINNKDNSTGINASLIFSCDSGERKKASISYIDTGAYGTGDMVFALDNDADSGELHVTNHERMRITKDGLVGINQTAPAVELDIKSTSPEIRLTCSDNNLQQGDTIGQLGWYTTDPTTPGGAGTVSYINTFSANGNGADYSTKIFNRDGSGGGSTFIQLGNALGSIKFGTNTAGNAGIERLLIDSEGRLTLNQCDRTANVKALRIKADNDTTSTASTDRTGSNSYKNSAIVIQKGISNGGLVAGLIDAWDTAIHATSIGIIYTSGRYHTSFGVNNDTNDRPVEIMTISGNKRVKIGGGIANISADIGLEIGGDGATTEIRLKNSGGGTGQADGFAIQKWSNGNNYIYDYDSNSILFGTSNGSRTQMDSSGRWTFAPSAGSALTAGSTTIAMSIINNGGSAVSGSAYPGIAFKSTGTGGGNGMSIVNFDGNWDLYTYSGNQQGLGFLHSNSSSSGNARMTIGDDGKVCLGTQVYNYLNTSRYCNTALHVAGGAVSIGAVSSYSGANRGGVYTLGWYTTVHANAQYYHIKTDLWAGGSPHGNNEYIMGGFRIEGYSYSSPTGSSTAWVQFHNWSGSYPGLSVKQHYHNWDMGATVYTSSDGYVVLRVKGGTYKSHVIDLIQHIHYPSRDIGVASFAQNNSATHF